MEIHVNISVFFIFYPFRVFSYDFIMPTLLSHMIAASNTVVVDVTN